MKEVVIKALRCKQCDHTWVPRKPRVYVCPNCHSHRWNEPKREAVSK